ncbi:hypothetical protein JTB14_024958 [Gonioctena quinquepunctata]|nr:hypothetical protein JTB14_024958 [Gonioctena quinquepunctata]
MENVNRRRQACKARSVDEVDLMTDMEIKQVTLSGSSRSRMKRLIHQGTEYLEAKRTIIKDNFLRIETEEALKEEKGAKSNDNFLRLGIEEALKEEKRAKSDNNFLRRGTEEALKREKTPEKIPNSEGNTRVLPKSLKEIDSLTDKEIQQLSLSGSARQRMKKLLRQGTEYFEAKRSIVKENFVRRVTAAEASIEEKVLPNSGGSILTHFNSVEEIDSLTDTELQEIRMAHSSRQRMKKLLQQGFEHLEAKRSVIKNNFLRQVTKSEMLKTEKLPYSPSNDQLNENIAQKRLKPESDSDASNFQKKAKLEQDKVIQIGEKIAVIHTGYPEVKMEPGRVEEVQHSIIKAYESVPDQGPQVRFLKSTPRPGYLEIICADKISMQWLKDTIPLLQPWEGAILRALEGIEVPTWTAYSVYIPNEGGQMLDVERILTRLRVGNHELNTKNWEVIKNIPMEKGRLWVFMIDKDSEVELQKLDMQPFFGIGRIEFQTVEDSIQES